jgi:hypothetical protein
MKRTGLFLLVVLAAATTAWGFMYTTGDCLGPGIEYRPIQSFCVRASEEGSVPEAGAYILWGQGFFSCPPFYPDTAYTYTYFLDEEGNVQRYYGMSISEILEKVAKDLGADAIVDLKYDFYDESRLAITGTAVKILDNGVSTEPPR